MERLGSKMAGQWYNFPCACSSVAVWTCPKHCLVEDVGSRGRTDGVSLEREVEHVGIKGGTESMVFLDITLPTSWISTHMSFLSTRISSNGAMVCAFATAVLSNVSASASSGKTPPRLNAQILRQSCMIYPCITYHGSSSLWTELK